MKEKVSIVFSNDDFDVLVRDLLFLIGGGVGGAHDLVAMVDFQEDDFAIHEVVVHEDEDHAQLDDGEEAFNDHQHQVGDGVRVHELADDDRDADDGHEQEQDDAQGLAAPVPADLGSEVVAPALRVLLILEADLVAAVPALDLGEVDLSPHRQQAASDVLEEAVLVILERAATGVDEAAAFPEADPALGGELLVQIVEDDVRAALQVIIIHPLFPFHRTDFLHELYYY